MKKKAVDLKPGDVVPENSSYYARVVCSVGPSESGDGYVAVRFYNVKYQTCDVMAERAGSEFEVESPTLSPAQQHAEELLAFVRTVEGSFLHEIEKRRAEASLLLARIDPPKPPSVEEAAELLSEAILATRDGFEPLDRRISQFLERARAAGYLGKDAQ